jgi:hypothetical protein
VFLNDPLPHRRVAFAVPRAFRIDDRDDSSDSGMSVVGALDTKAHTIHVHSVVVAVTEGLWLW